MCVIYSPRTGCWYPPQKPRLYCLCSDGIALYQGVRRVSLMFACRDLGWCRLAMSPLVLYPLARVVRFCKKIQCSLQSCFQTCPWLYYAESWWAGQLGVGCFNYFWWRWSAKGKKWQQGQISSANRANPWKGRIATVPLRFLSSRRRASPDGANHL